MDTIPERTSWEAGDMRRVIIIILYFFTNNLISSDKITIDYIRPSYSIKGGFTQCLIYLNDPSSKKSKNTKRRLFFKGIYDTNGRIIEMNQFSSNMIESKIIYQNEISQKMRIENITQYLYQDPKKVYSDTHKIFFQTLLYDSLNRITKYTSYNDNILSENIFYLYNSNNLIEELEYDNKDSLRYKTVYKYSDEGKLIEKNRYDRNCKKPFTKIYNYKDNGKYQEKIIFDGLGEVYIKYISIFNSNNLCVEFLETPDGPHFLYIYDNSGNLIKEFLKIKNRKILYKAYKYDKFGNMTEFSKYENNKRVYYQTYEYSK
jgi:hypothetical protein